MKLPKLFSHKCGFQIGKKSSCYLLTFGRCQFFKQRVQYNNLHFNIRIGWARKNHEPGRFLWNLPYVQAKVCSKDYEKMHVATCFYPEDANFSKMGRCFQKSVFLDPYLRLWQKSGTYDRIAIIFGLHYLLKIRNFKLILALIWKMRFFKTVQFGIILFFRPMLLKPEKMLIYGNKFYQTVRFRGS